MSDEVFIELNSVSASRCIIHINFFAFRIQDFPESFVHKVCLEIRTENTSIFNHIASLNGAAFIPDITPS